MPEPTTITEAAEFIRRGELTPSDLLEQCLARIDKYEERVRAWVHIDREGAREQAAKLTAELKQNYRGPLHGIPVGIKDIIDVFDMPTACGSKRWAQSYARRDATCVERLRQAGAVIVGKTVTTAYASFDPPPTRNPWNLDRTPGGSSSGSAAAVACGMCLGALASQTGGSITRPASYCGVYSLKPTYGRVSVDGVLPLAPSMDHVGVMANCVRDVAILFRTIAGADERDAGTRKLIVPDPFGERYDPPNDPDWHEEHWVCGTDDFFPSRCDDAMRIAFDAAVRKVVRSDPTDAKVGRLQPIALPAGFGEVTDRHHTVMAVEAAAYHEPRFRRHPDDYPPKITALIERGLRTSAAEYARCKEAQARLTQELRMPRFRVLLVPATRGAAPPADTTGDPVFNSPWSFTGMPVVSLPFAWTPDGLPLAVQLVAKQGQENDLFQTAAWVERVIGFTRRALPL